MTFDEFTAPIEKVKRKGNKATGLCPAHPDKEPSLSISLVGKKILLHCHAGCEPEAIVSAMGLEMRDLFTDSDPTFSGAGNRRKTFEAAKLGGKPKEDPKNWRVKAVYDYTDESGAVLYHKERLESDGGRKSFRQCRADGNGGKTYNLDGVRRVPYNLKELAKVREAGDSLKVFLVEGEKDSDNLKRLNAEDPLSARGVWVSSLKDWEEPFNANIKGAEVFIFRDHDSSGKQQADKAARIVSEVAKSVKVIDLFPDSPEKGQDVTDWIERRKRHEGADEEAILKELITKAELAPIWSDPDAERIGLDIEYLSTVEAKEINWLCAPLIPFGFFTLLDGVEGIGKTYAMLDLAKRLTRGGKMPFKGGEVHEPAKVLFLSVEDSPEFVLRPRFEKMGGDLERLAVLRGSFEFDLAGFDDLEATIKKENIKFVLIDPIFSFTGRADINNTADVRPITDRLNTIAATHGIAVLGIRHLNKSKGYGDPANAGAHARAWRQGCRSNLFIGHDAGDKSRRGIAQTKLNVGAESKEVYGFEIDPEGVFQWTGESDLTVSEMTAQVTNETNEERSAKSEAMAFLRNLLSDGPKDNLLIREEARGYGISEKTLRRAKDALNVKSKKKNFGQGWDWCMAEDAET